jgi:hypothetical protein
MPGAPHDKPNKARQLKRGLWSLVFTEDLPENPNSQTSLFHRHRVHHGRKNEQKHETWTKLNQKNPSNPHSTPWTRAAATKSHQVQNRK